MLETSKITTKYIQRFDPHELWIARGITFPGHYYKHPRTKRMVGPFGSKAEALAAARQCLN